MGNFEKLGVLLIITLVVVILVIMIWGMNSPVDELFRDADGNVKISMEARTDGRDAREEERRDEPVPVPSGERPTPWPITIVEPPDPTPAEPDPVPPAPDLRHTVQKNETLYGLAEHYYGAGKYYKVIIEANPGVTPTNLKPGVTVLVIPNRDDVLGGGGATPIPPVPDGGERYVVQKNDSLWALAKRFLGSGSKYRVIHDANRDVIGDDPGNLHDGMVILIPR